MIMPNANLIANRVTNWTFSDSQRLIELPIPVAQAADPDHVIELLKKRRFHTSAGDQEAAAASIGCQFRSRRTQL